MFKCYAYVYVYEMVKNYVQSEGYREEQIFHLTVIFSSLNKINK